jgi:hypothetical protein
MATDIIGNAGTIVFSQFNPYGNGVIGSEWWNVGLRGPVNVNLTTSPVTSGSGVTPSPTPQLPANTGLIAFSQFNAGGYFKIGSQLRDIRLGAGLTVNSYDESVISASETIPTTATITTAAGVIPISPAQPTNIGDIINSQFNDFGFGPIGLQLDAVQAGGGLSITNQTLLRNPDGSIATPATGSATAAVSPVPIPTVDLRANSGLIQNTQFNDGGFGKLGIQWDQVHVQGSISVSSQTYAVEPGVANPFGPTPYPKPRPNGRTYGDPSNTGTLKNTQFNDGGFGDVGMQWKNVKVGGRVSTSTNALSIQPNQSNLGPFSVGPRVFGQGGLTAVPISPAAALGTVSAASAVAPTAVPVDDPLKNEATNSGTVLNSQFSDGGFGDVGMQWLDVAVRHNVSTVDNSLSIQPENQNQGLITVQGIQFPANPGAPAPQPSLPFHILPATPTPVSSTGTTPVPILPKPTKPGATSFAQNDATNSGNVLDSQVSDGGFGDIGLQWAHVKVGAVRIVHNSFSIRPEGTNLAGVSASNVLYGDANPKNAKARAAADRKLATLPTTIIDPSNLPPDPTPIKVSDQVPLPQPKNHGALNDVQFPKILTAPLSLQWYGVVTTRGLVLVHNTIQIKLADPATTGLITLSGIRMPAPIPAPTIEVTTNTQPAVAALASGASSAAALVPSIDASTNSGILLGSQFSDGGFGDIGTQWRKVKIHGGVSVVHNTMSVDVSGTNTGPISIANVAFRSGALDGATGIRIITPPSYWSKLQIGSKGSAKALGHSAAVVDNASNSGLIDGGQFATGGMSHIMLQWQKVGIPGSVTILDNVLSISITGHQTGPITISNVTFS